MITAPLPLVTPLSVALTNRVTVPTLLPAVKLTGLLFDELSAPMFALPRVHENVVPGRHVAVQVGIAVKAWPCPTSTDALVGETETETNDGGGVDVMVILVGKLCLVTPWNVALTMRDTAPGEAPAVNVVVGVVAELSVPIIGFVTLHE